MIHCDFFIVPDENSHWNHEKQQWPAQTQLPPTSAFCEIIGQSDEESTEIAASPYASVGSPAVSDPAIEMKKMNGSRRMAAL